MNVTVHPSKVRGTVSAPASKSYSHRALLAASVAKGVSHIKNLLKADDIEVTIKALKNLGTSISQENDLTIVQGNGGHFHLPAKNVVLDCCDSGTSLRFLTALSSLSDGQVTLDGSSRLRARPIDRLVRALTDMGVDAYCTEGNFAPVQIKGGTLQGGTLLVDGSESSQFISALLLIAPFARKDVTVTVSNLCSAPYVDVTIDVMKSFGVSVIQRGDEFTVKAPQAYQGTDYSVEGDFSSASYFLAAAAVTGSKVKVTDLNPDSIQADVKILSILKQMGCSVRCGRNWVEVTGAPLTALSLEMSDCPDLVPVVSVLAAFAKGTTVISNIGHVRLKESDRIKAVSQELAKMGIACNTNENSLTVIGGKPQGTKIEVHNDHRIAMSFSVAALGASGKTEIINAQAVSKSYPDFYNHLKSLGVALHYIE